MRPKVFIFLFAVALSLLIVPFINILTSPNRNSLEWEETDFSYNMDFASRLAAKLFSPLGISINPRQVIIGRDGWLFLGDKYEQSRAADSPLSADENHALNQEINNAAIAWEAYLSHKGVKVFKIAIAPNKGTIYPEYLPSWARLPSPDATDELIAGTAKAVYIDLRAGLLAAKPHQQAIMYFKTDSHWNSLGGGLAFKALAQQLSKPAPELAWPSQDAYELERVYPRKGGDLANFLRLKSSFSDFEPIIHASSLSIDTTQTDFDTGQLLYQVGNPTIDVPNKPLLVRSAGALNHKKLLWLRDSFGTALSPLIAATFSEVLQIHWGEAIKQDGRLAQLVEDWKPDYVFLTVVERDARNPAFTTFPPPIFTALKNTFQPIRTTSISSLNHLSQDRKNNEFHITGSNPYVDFSVSEKFRPQELNYLSIDFSCADGSKSVPMQLFWLPEGQAYFNEENSAQFSFPAGQNLIDLRSLQKWGSATAISRIRVDINARNGCTHFKLNMPTLGLNAAEFK